MQKRLVWILTTLAALGLPASLAWQDAPSPAPEPSATPALQVTRAVACLEVRDREPVSIDSVFSNQTPQIYCYTQIDGASEPAEIQHVWIHGGEEKAVVTLPVRGTPWRTYSSKKMLPEWTGAWKVEIRDASGGVLKTVEFSVTEGEAGSAPPQ
jgi:hypothetical protein